MIDHFTYRRPSPDSISLGGDRVFAGYSRRHQILSMGISDATDMWLGAVVPSGILLKEGET